MALLTKRAYNAECDRCRELDESSETGAPWYYDSPDEALTTLRDQGWVTPPDGRLLCPTCVEAGAALPELRCTCPCGRGTNPGCPVCP